MTCTISFVEKSKKVKSNVVLGSGGYSQLTNSMLRITQKMSCEFSEDMRGFGFLAGNKGVLKAGTTVDLPFWAVASLADLDQRYASSC